MYTMPPFLEATIDWESLPGKGDWVFVRSTQSRGRIVRLFKRNLTKEEEEKYEKSIFGEVEFTHRTRKWRRSYNIDDLEYMYPPVKHSAYPSGYMWKVEEPCSFSVRDVLIKGELPEDYLWCNHLRIFVENEDVCLRRCKDEELFGRCVGCDLSPLVGEGEEGWEVVEKYFANKLKERK